MTTPSSLFSIKIYKKSVKNEFIKLQSAGDENIWPTFLLHNLPGLRKSSREDRGPINYTNTTEIIIKDINY